MFLLILASCRPEPSTPAVSDIAEPPDTAAIGSMDDFDAAAAALPVGVRDTSAFAPRNSRRR